MKAVAALTTWAFAASALAEDWTLPKKRDVQTISTVITNVQGAMQSLDDSVKAFNGGDFQKLISDVTNLKTSLESGTQQIQSTSAITANEAVSLQGTLGPVQTVATSLASDLTSKKAEVEKASLCDVVFSQTKDIGTAAKGLIDATVSKTPAEIQPLASQLTSQFSGQLEDTAKTFATGNCTNAGTPPIAASNAGTSRSNATASSGTNPASTGTTNSGTTASAAMALAVPAFGLVAVAAAGLLPFMV